jgi:hypothetical protein
MVLAFDVRWEYIFLAAVVAFIVLCTLISIILKEIYRRR